MWRESPLSISRKPSGTRALYQGTPSGRADACSVSVEAMRASARERGLAILPIQQLPHRLPPLGVHLTVGLEFVFAAPRSGLPTFRLRAIGTAVGKARLVRHQFEFFTTNHTLLDRIRHGNPTASSMPVALGPMLSYSAVVGSIVERTCEILLAGKPPCFACSRTAASSGAMYTQ